MSRPERIHPSGNPAALAVTPNLVDYAGTRARFRWSDVRAALDGLPDGGLNIAWEAVERHARSARRDHTALRWLGLDGARQDISYGELAALSSRFAGVLRQLGVGRGERVFLLNGRVPELYVSALGTLKNASVLAPLFTAFGPEPLCTRLSLGEARVLVTTRALYTRKVAALRERLPALRDVLLTDLPPGAPPPSGTRDWHSLMAAADPHTPTVSTAPGEPALLHFTSGTTGRPKGALHVHEAVLTHWMTGLYALDLHAGDTFWCTADPGWVTGTSYGIIAPLLHGVTSVVDEADFDAERWYRILQDEAVSVWYTAPTALRMLMRAGSEPARRYRRPALRFIASVGEPLNPEAIWWARETLGLPVHDNWWQTETGGIMLANTAAFDIKPGSMGRPLPGIDACVVERLPGGGVRRLEQPDAEGELALRRGWPSMFRGYLGQAERYEACFSDGLYLTGDLARRDAEGYFWFVGRADDVIKSAGHLIGPFEVESALLEHPAVAEAGVIGMPDALSGERVVAFVSLQPGQAPSPALQRALLAHGRRRLGAAVAPKAIHFLDNLPRTRSGKILRRLLKARQLGLPEGDTSTLECPP